LRHTSFIRLCQPSPVARKRSSTSASTRREIACFRARDAGLPRRTSLCPSKTSDCRSSSSVSSGASSPSDDIVPAFLFLGMTVPHRNDVPRIAARCPDENDHAFAQPAGGNITILAIVEPAIRNDGMSACENVCCRGEVESSLQQSPLAFLRVERDPYLFTYIHKLALGFKVLPHSTSRAPVPCRRPA
jgi:hypothetical protein